MKYNVFSFAIIVFITFLLTGCGKDEYINSVTKMPVYFTVDLVKDSELENPQQYKIYTKRDLIYAGEYIESPGVIVINTGDIYDTGNEFAAYDIRCPYEDRIDRLLNINIEETAAQCSSCGAKYNLMYGGPCTNGVTKKTLQGYCISPSSGSKLLKVYNCK